MPENITAPQLEAIQRILTNPLTEKVRAEVDAGNARQEAAIERIAAKLEAHVVEAARQAEANTHKLRRHSERIASLEKRMSKVEAFKKWFMGIYTAAASIGGALFTEGLRWLVWNWHKPQ